MKKHSKKLIALFGALFLFIAILPSALGVQTMYFMSSNDKVVDYKAETHPFISGGVVYVPFHMFIAEENGGTSLGVFYGISERYNTLSLYSRSEPILTFDRNGANAYDAAGNTYSFHAITRNGITFVPAAAVCEYFNLEYSYLPNDLGVLIRVKKSGSYWLNDRMFLSSANYKFVEQKQDFDKDQALQISPSSPAPSTGVADKSRIRISFAFRCQSAEGIDTVLDVFQGTDVKGLFFIRPDQLPKMDDQVRRLLAQGHRVGFTVDGADVEACLAQAEEGNRLLAHIARSKTDFLLTEGETSLTDSLAETDWVCWKGNINGIPNREIRPASLASNILLNAEAKRSYGRILMEDSQLCTDALAHLIPQLHQSGYTFHAITETDLT